MPTANPILGEEAWFWGEVKESGAVEAKQEKQQQIMDNNRKKINNLRRSFSSLSRQEQK